MNDSTRPPGSTDDHPVRAGTGPTIGEPAAQGFRGAAGRRGHLAALGGLGLGAALAAWLPREAWAQAYPNKPIRMVVPYTPGGFTDTMARLLGEPLGRALGQTMVFDNKPGANSLIGADMVAKAAPDGYTLATVIAAHSVNPGLYAKMPFDPVNDFSPVTVIGKAPVILCANNDAPFNTIAELIAYAKANPGKLSYGSSGVGAAAHLTMEYFCALTGTKMVHIPYKGTAPALTDLISGQILALWDVTSTMMPHIKAGKVKVIAIASEKRVGVAPDVPTVDENGLPGFFSSTWAMLLAPAHTPKDIVQRLSSESARLLHSPELHERFDQLGVVPGGDTPEQALAFLKAEVDKWGKVVREANIKID
ncbi:MAG: tripartite tricarboxylate transporter substrate binding protein [Burkholderiaceae bacterium]